MIRSALEPVGPLPLGRPEPQTHGQPLRHDLQRQTRFQGVLHELHWDARAKTINALADPIDKTHVKAANRMAACGGGASFFINPERGQVRPWISRCGHRLCPFCSTARSASTTADLIELILKYDAQRMMVLTLQSNDLPLPDQIRSLLAAFKKLRNRATWKKHVEGGVYVLEITLNAKTGQWHPHLHILARGNYYPHAELSKQWREVTHGSNVVWVSRVEKVDAAAKELAKYIGKPQRIAELSPERIREYASAIKSVRMVQTFGSAHGTKLRDEDQVDEKPTKDSRVRLSTLIRQAKFEIPEASMLLSWLCRRYKIFGRFVHRELPDLVPNYGGYDKAAAMLAAIRGEKPPPGGLPVDELPDEEIERQICICYQAYRLLDESGRLHEITYHYKPEFAN